MINASLVKELREKLRERDWDVSIMVCKKALVRTNGAVEEAMDILYRWGYIIINLRDNRMTNLNNKERNDD